MATILKSASSFRGIPHGFDAHIRSGHDALVAAGLDYTVDSVPLSTVEPDAPFAQNFFKMVRSSDGAYVGVRSSRFHQHQPQVLGVLADAVLKLRSDAYVDSAGQSPNGQLQFLSVTLNDEPIVGPNGGQHRKILLVNGTNGNSKLRGIAYNLELACMNQFPAIFRKGSELLSLGHTWSAAQALPTAMRALQDSVRIYDEMDAEIERLLSTPVNAPMHVLGQVVGPRPEEGRAVTEWEKRFDAIVAEYRAEWNDNIRGTAWGVVMAAQGADEHASKSKRGLKDTQRVLRVIRNQYPLMGRALTLVGA